MQQENSPGLSPGRVRSPAFGKETTNLEMFRKCYNKNEQKTTKWSHLFWNEQHFLQQFRIRARSCAIVVATVAVSVVTVVSCLENAHARGAVREPPGLLIAPHSSSLDPVCVLWGTLFFEPIFGTLFFKQSRVF